MDAETEPPEADEGAPPPAPGPQPAVPDPPSMPGPIALWRLYLALAASAGAYLPFWVWRTARQFGLGAADAKLPAWWAVGSLGAPVAACVLYELNRRATAHAGTRGRAAWPAFGYLGLFLLWALTPLGSYIVAFALLMPIPLLFVQHNINRAAGREGVRAHPRSGLRPALALSLTLGLPLLGAAVWLSDWPALRTDMGRRLGKGDVVSGTSGLYTLTLPGAGWRRVAPGTIGDPNADLELVGPGPATWVVAYSEAHADASLESVVASRRSLLLDQIPTVGYREQRYFLEASPQLLPASLAVYDVRDGIVPGRYIVLSAELDSRVVELVGYTVEPLLRADELRGLLQTLRADAGKQER